MINIQPTLIGKILRLRPIKPEDFELVYKVASDKLIWEQHPEPQRYERQFFKERYFKKAIQCKGGLVVQNTKNEVIGCTRYYTYRPQTSDITIGYTFLARDYWGQIANKEMKHLMMTHIYQWVDTIYFTVGVNNKRSRRAIEKIGGLPLTPQQQIERNYVVPGSVIYQIKKQDFKGLIDTI